MKESETLELKKSTSELKEALQSILTNPLLAKTLYLSGFIDAWGRGILNIINLLKADGLEIPKFEQSGGNFRIAFNRETLQDRSEKSSEKSSEKIITLIKANPHLSAEDLSEKLGISSRAVEKNLAKLKLESKIKRVGPDKGGYLEVNLEKSGT